MEPPVIANLRGILARHQAVHLDPATGRRASKRRGVLVDATTATAVITVYDGLSPENQAAFAAMRLLRMVDVAWKVLERARAGERGSR